ncbi:hypothetical protein [Sulfurospirillum arcachonense]|uniref:hypothetical protein n=1 Tax=Sulfurospirillum arcachonense TaxID=57666 RepID=UPI00046A4651|nr:hypothetical protein [Sulfurospirillum arcachonense]
MKELELLYDLIPHHPGLFISIIEDENYECVTSLAKFSQSINASLHVKSLKQKIYPNHLHVDDFSFEQNRYNHNAIQYDFLFLCASLEKKEDITEIANKLYRIIKNAGHLFILSKKESTDSLSKTFENSNFVALNSIELNAQYNIISAKKMHGWMRV